MGRGEGTGLVSRSVPGMRGSQALLTPGTERRTLRPKGFTNNQHDHVDNKEDRIPAAHKSAASGSLPKGRARVRCQEQEVDRKGRTHNEDCF